MLFRSSRGAPLGVGFGTVSDYGDKGKQGWLPINDAGLPLRGFARAQSSIQRVVGRSAAPLLIARSVLTHTTVSDRLPGMTSGSQATQLTEAFPTGWSGTTTVMEASEFHPSGSPQPALTKMWPVTMAAPRLLRRSAWRIKKSLLQHQRQGRDCMICRLPPCL